MDSFEQAKILVTPVDVEAVCHHLLDELVSFLKDNSLENSLDFVKGYLACNGCQSLQSELAISTLASDMINTWQPKHGCELLRALIVLTSAVPNSVSERSVRTATRYVAENAKLDHSREELRLVTAAIAQFLRKHPHSFKTRRLQDLLFLECKDSFFIALEVAPILLGENNNSLNRVPLRDVVDALFSRQEFGQLPGEERIRVAKKLAHAMPIEYWAENLSELESHPSEDFNKWTPRRNFLSILLLGEEPIVGVFPMLHEDKTVLAFPEVVKEGLKNGILIREVISNVGARLEENLDQEYTASPNPIQELIIEAISNSSDWSKREAAKQPVIILDDFRQDNQGNNS